MKKYYAISYLCFVVDLNELTNLKHIQICFLCAIVHSYFQDVNKTTTLFMVVSTVNHYSLGKLGMIQIREMLDL